MCIVFIYSGNEDPDSIYSLVLASNRDEYFDRQAQNMAPWKENQNIFGGKFIILNAKNNSKFYL